MGHSQEHPHESLGEFPYLQNFLGESIVLPRSSRPVSKEVLEDDEKRRQEFLIRVIELADDFDTADHEFASNGMGTDLQDDCRAVREL